MVDTNLSDRLTSSTASQFGEAEQIIVQNVVSASGSFLGRICLPAAEEFGLLLRDKVRNWRARNAQNVLDKAEPLWKRLPNYEARHAHPRLVGAILENASWSDAEPVHLMWAGLLASSCTETGKDETNLIFINLMTNLIREEILLLNYFCENAIKVKSPGGWLSVSEDMVISLEKLESLCKDFDIHTIDLLLDHLRELGLLSIISGFHVNSTDALIHPTAMALNLYVRGQGYVGSSIEYFGL